MKTRAINVLAAMAIAVAFLSCENHPNPPGESRKTATARWPVVENEKVRLTLDAARHYCPVALTAPDAPNANALAPISLSLSTTPKSHSLNEYYNFSAIKSACRVERVGDRTSRVVSEKWPFFNVVKTFVFFGNKPYFQLKYRVEVTRELKTERLTLALGSAKGYDLLCFPDGDKVVYRRKQPNENWFSVPRDGARWIAFIDEKRGEAFSAIGADPVDWDALPPRIVCVDKKDGGFGVELIKSVDRDLRPGDKIAFDLFIYIPENADDIANRNARILTELCPNY